MSSGLSWQGLIGVSLAAALGSAPPVANAAGYYVSPTGLDTNVGSLASPFRTVQKAASIALAGDIVYLRAGTYRETVVPAHSGTPNAPITFRPYGSEVAIISGTELISGWSQVSGNIWAAPMPGGFFNSSVNQSDQVFVDGQMMNLARWPNTAFNSTSNPTAISYPVKSTITTFISKSRDTATNITTAVFEDAQLSPAIDGYYVGAEIVIQPNDKAWSWTLSGVVVDQVGTQLTIESYNDSGQDGNSAVYPVGSRYYLHNQASMLDAAGEWYHDQSAGLVYLITPASDSPSLHTIEAKKRDYCFNLSDRSYITLQKLTFTGCYVTTDDVSGGDGIPYDEFGNTRYPWRGAGYSASAHHILLDGITAKYLSHFTDMSGHFFIQWGQHAGMVLSGSDNIIQNSNLQYSAGNGVVLLGYRNKVLNNTISDVSYQQVDTAAIHTGGAADTFDHEIASNTIRRTGRSGMALRRLANTDSNSLVTRIHHNDIGNVMLQDWDGGCVYLAYQDANFTRIDHNKCHDASGFTASGIYPDYTKNLIVDHNVIWNVEWGIHPQGDNGGVNNVLAYNNTIAVKNTSNTPYGPFGFGNNSGSNNGTVGQNNILYVYMPSGNGYLPISGNFDGALFSNNLAWDRVTNSSTDPQFVNTSTFDFGLKSTSPAINTGVQVPTYTRDGITVPAFNDAHSGAAPDLGAYEYGVTKWVAGITTLKPAAPTGLVGTPKAASAVLSWDPVFGAAAYSVKRSLTSGGPYSAVATGLTTTSYTNTGLTNGTTYYYVVTATNSSSESLVSNQVTVTPQPAPTAVTSLTATAGVGSVQLNWVPSVSGNVTETKVYRSTSASGTYGLQATLSATSNTWTNTGLSKGQVFYYKVSVSNAYGETLSAAVSATVK